MEPIGNTIREVQAKAAAQTIKTHIPFVDADALLTDRSAFLRAAFHHYDLAAPVPGLWVTFQWVAENVYGLSWDDTYAELIADYQAAMYA